jgi:hypothetical protein
MEKKKKIRLVVLWPTVLTVIVIGGILAFVLLAGAGKAHSQTMQGAAGGGQPTVAQTPGSSAGSTGEDAPALQTITPPDMTPQVCDFKEWIGKPVDEAAVKATGRPYRILKPGDAATMDFSPARIDVITGDDGTVTDVHCG